MPSLLSYFDSINVCVIAQAYIHKIKEAAARFATAPFVTIPAKTRDSGVVTFR